MSALLEKDPTKRLGAGPSGYQDLKDHRFFDGLNFDDLLARQIEPPYKPDGERYGEDAELENGIAAPPKIEFMTVIEKVPEDDGWLEGQDEDDQKWLLEFGPPP